MPTARRQFLIDLAAGAAAVTILPKLLRAQDKPSVVVYKDPNCGCCGKWVDHIRANGFAVSVNDSADMNEIKARYQVGDKLRSCHTAVVGGYVVEGHVPAGDIKRLLAEKPKVHGLTIPGMPASAPGMDMTPHQPYTVLTFTETGATRVFAEH